MSGYDRGAWVCVKSVRAYACVRAKRSRENAIEKASQRESEKTERKRGNRDAERGIRRETVNDRGDRDSQRDATQSVLTRHRDPESVSEMRERRREQR